MDIISSIYEKEDTGYKLHSLGVSAEKVYYTRKEIDENGAEVLRNYSLKQILDHYFNFISQFEICSSEKPEVGREGVFVFEEE